MCNFITNHEYLNVAEVFNRKEGLLGELKGRLDQRAGNGMC